MTELYAPFALGLAILLDRARGRPIRTVLWAVAVACVLFSLLLFVSHLNFINTMPDRPQGDRATVEIRYQLTQSDFGITW